MKTKNIMIILVLFILIIPLIKADFYVCFEEGEQYSWCNPKVNYYRCGNYDHCTCESDGKNCGPICMSEYDEERSCYNQGNPGLCMQSGACLPGGMGEIDQDPPEITLDSPVEGEVYDSRSVLFNITLDEIGDADYYDNINGRGQWKRLFRDKSSYSRSLSMDEGFNSITIKARDGVGNKANITVTFYVDSVEPKIRKTLPEEGYVSTIFAVEYDEENLQSVVLHYDQGEGWVDVELENCESGIRQTCSSEDIDLEDGAVEYYFTISDFATSVDSDVISLIVDTTDPIITINDPQSTPYNTKKIPLDIDLSEDVELLEYLDAADPNGRWRKLCKNCEEYDKTKSFKEGYHDLILRATDYAGNDAEEMVSFTVDSKDPKIKRIEPRKGKYGNGTFYIKYQEDNLQSISLFYKEESETEYTAVSNEDCPSGKNAECYFYVPELEGVAQKDHSYYFIVYDLATDVQSKIYNFILDSVAPEFTKVDKTMNGRKVYFDIELNEDSTLEYLDSFDGDKAKFRRLCSNCDSYDRRKSFRIGHHELTLKATDKAGNVNEAEISFSID